MRSNAKKVFSNLAKALAKAQEDLPKILANEGTRYFMESFRKESWDGKRWRPRTAYSRKENKNPLLIGRTRQLKNAVNNSVKEANQRRIKWGVYVPYGSVHNYGFRGIVYTKQHHRTASRKVQVSTGTFNIKNRKANYKTIRADGIRHNVSGSQRKLNIPKRQFMGISKELNKRFKQKAEMVFGRISRQFK